MQKALLLFSIFPVITFSVEPALKELLEKLEEKGVLTEEEISAIEKKAKKEPHLKVKIRLQPRIDLGDIYKKNGKFKSKSDFYLRRVRLEVDRKWKKIPLGKSLKLNITLKADKSERNYNYKSGKKKYRAPQVRLHYAYADWKIIEEFAVRIGIKKAPYSRIALTSSSRQLLIERPFSVEDAKDWLGEYISNQIMFHGKIAKGVFRYMLSVSDGSTIEDENMTDYNVKSDVKFGNFYALRLEFSPPGFVEKKKDDTGIGYKNKGNVISLGISYAKNRNFDLYDNNNLIVKDEEGTVYGADIFGRFKFGFGVLTAQAEYVKMKYDRINVDEKGWYIQGGILFDTIKFGKVEPAFRYENVDYEGNNDKKITTLGFNHYIKLHKIKWTYNVLLIDNEGKEDQIVHQLQAQFYF